MEGENYYLYVVGITHPGGLFTSGDCGVGKTSLGPGMCDCLYGTLYVFPGNLIKYSQPCADTIKRYALNYYLMR